MFTDTTLDLPNGARQLVRVGGSGPPLVWLHGLDGPDVDQPLVRSLAERFTVYAPQSPGFEGLEELLDLDDVHALALYYDDLLEALGLEEVTVVGHSFGAMVAAELAAHVPRRVKQLALISAVGLWDDDDQVADLFAVPLMELDAFLYGDPSKAPAPADPHDVEAFVRYSQAMTTVAKYLWPIPDRRIHLRTHRIDAPTVIVHGEEDRWVPVSYAERWRAQIRGSRTVTVPGTGHLVTRENPDAVLEAIEGLVGAEVPTPAS